MADSQSGPRIQGNLPDHARAIFPECVELRRRLHSLPELSNGEVRTAETISSFLSGHGLRPYSYDFPSVVCDTGPEPSIALRADMDALPIREESGEPFSSLNEGVMHACGHDAHSAMLACAGVLISGRMRRSVRLIFQPAEEVGEGAKRMIESGVLDGIEKIFGLHVWPSLDTGTIAILRGPAMAANALFSVRLKGNGGHGAYPHLAQDTITAASSFVMDANTIVSRNIDPLDSAVVSFGEMHGGGAANVIPSEMVLKGTIRSFSRETQGRVKAALERMLEGTSSLFGVGSSIEWYREGPAVVNEAAAAAQCAELFEPEIRVVDCKPTMGSEDFAYYLHRVGGAFAFLGTGGNEETRRSKHSSTFRLDESSLYHGIVAEVLAGEGL